MTDAGYKHEDLLNAVDVTCSHANTGRPYIELCIANWHDVISRLRYEPFQQSGLTCKVTVTDD